MIVQTFNIKQQLFPIFWLTVVCCIIFVFVLSLYGYVPDIAKMSRTTPPLVRLILLLPLLGGQKEDILLSTKLAGGQHEPGKGKGLLVVNVSAMGVMEK